MRLGHTTGKTRYKVLYQHTMYVHVISLSNISIKTNKNEHFVQYCEGDYICAWCDVICCSTFADVTLLFDHFQCHCTVSRQRLFILVMWIVQLPEILKACPYKLECAYFAYNGVYFRILDNDTYDKVVRQMKFRATSRHSFITTVWWYNILYHKLCIREATFVNFKGKCA